MELVLPVDHSNSFALIYNNYNCTGDIQVRSNGIRINLNNKSFCYLDYRYPIETDKHYVPKVLIDGRLLRQAQLLMGLGLSNKELAEMLRNQEELFIHPVRESHDDSL